MGARARGHTCARLLVRRQDTAKGLSVGDLGLGTGLLTVREVRGEGN